MPTAQERAKKLAQQIMKAMQEAKQAEAKAMALGEEMIEALAEARLVAQAAETIIEYPSGRYECKQCKHSVLFTEPASELPPCDNCGSREYNGHEPTITKVIPPAPKRYAAGMYHCSNCRARIAVAEDVDELPQCDFCGETKLTAIAYT